MSEQRSQDDRAGTSDHSQHRAGPGEGVRAPEAGELGHAEHSVFDGKGNESVVVTTTNEEGRVKEGTGPSSEAAMADAKDPKEPIGEGFGPSAEH